MGSAYFVSWGNVTAPSLNATIGAFFSMTRRWLLLFFKAVIHQNNDNFLALRINGFDMGNNTLDPSTGSISDPNEVQSLGDLC